MTDGVYRDLGDVVPGRRREAPREPIAPAIPTPPAASGVIVPPPPRPAPARSIFGGGDSTARGTGRLDGALAPLCELLLHKNTHGPLCVGLIGGPGSGKSFGLARLTRRIGLLAREAGSASQGPFVSRVHVQTIDAAALDGDPTLAIAARLHAGLLRDYPELAHEFGAASRDPHAVLREANDKLDEARRRLDTERRALDEAETRRARLTEVVLYEASGSQVDAYARANRTGIESRLKSFGLGGDPIRTYKDLVQTVASAGGASGLALRALWAFKGQTRLIVIAVLLAALAAGLGVAIEQQAIWLTDLRNAQHSGAAIADWAEAHIEWLATAQTAATLLAGLALVANLVRAGRFLQPILKGAKLLDSDLDERRRSLDGHYAHQTKRVDLLDADVEKLGRAVSDAERRTDGVAPRGPSAFDPTGTRPEEVFATLSRLLRQTSFAVPQRIVLAFDHLDAIAPERARGLLDLLHRTSAPGLVAIAAFDPQRLAGPATAPPDLERWIDVPYRLDAIGADGGADHLLREALGQATPETPPDRLDARNSSLDAPVSDEETAILSGMAALAGSTPRAIRRLAGLYLLTRQAEPHRPLLAFLIAVGLGGTERERALVAAALQGEPSAPFRVSAEQARLADAFGYAMEAEGLVPIGEAVETARRAATVSLA